MSGLGGVRHFGVNWAMVVVVLLAGVLFSLAAALGDKDGIGSFGVFIGIFYFLIFGPAGLCFWFGYRKKRGRVFEVLGEKKGKWFLMALVR